MATSYYKLDIESRESVGKKSTKAIRREGKIPGTLSVSYTHLTLPTKRIV